MHHNQTRTIILSLSLLSAGALSLTLQDKVVAQPDKGKPAMPMPQAPRRSSLRSDLPKFVQYDWGGVYYLERQEYAKARQYFMTALQYAEGEVPRMRVKGLKPETIKQTCDLLAHLALLAFDDNLKQKDVYTPREPTDRSPTSLARYEYETKFADYKQLRNDWEWMERLENFADRALGREAFCMNRFRQRQTEMQSKDVNARYTLTRLAEQLGISKDPILDQPLKRKSISGGQANG